MAFVLVLNPVAPEKLLGGSHSHKWSQRWQLAPGIQLIPCFFNAIAVNPFATCYTYNALLRRKGKEFWDMAAALYFICKQRPLHVVSYNCCVSLLCAGMDKANLSSYTSGNLSHFSETFCVSPLISIAPPIFTSLIFCLVT